MFSTLLVVSSVAAVVADCGISDYSKIDCGYLGIEQSECESKGCCWAESSVAGTPFCFKDSTSDASCYGFQSAMKEPFSDSEVQTMRKYFLNNINIDGKGGIVAAPDYNTPGGSYYYHWMRDGALTMRCLQETASSFSEVEDIVKSYAQWVINAQNEADPNDIDVRTEPKFELPDGEVFSGAWCRPQNDGPGLRATSLILAANSLTVAGEKDFVSEYLWTGDDSKYHGGAIKYDLDYVVDNFASNTCDLWEEIRDADMFWNRVTMKKAMIVGSQFALTLGDQASAKKYMEAAVSINSTLYSSHFNGDFVQECRSRTRDSAVIVGFNDGFDSSDALFAPTSVEVAQTVSSYNTMFCNEYAVNTADTASGIPGVLYGRYQGDSYAGGNPWVLSTAALAGLFYRGANYITKHGVPSEEALAVWAAAFNVDSLSGSAEEIAEVFAAQGDGVLLRLRGHVEQDGFHLDEQIDRNTGKQMSAKDLTWSYAEVLNAMHHRQQYVAMASL